jgi:tetratricopeptide (TPR) repeat protein
MYRSAWTWKEGRLPKQVAAEVATRFEIGIYEAALEAEPRSEEILVLLDDLYGKKGFVEKGLEVELRLVKIRPKDPWCHYKVALSHTLLGHIDPAIQSLNRALQLGYSVESLRKDPGLANLRKDERYEELLRRFQKLKG